MNNSVKIALTLVVLSSLASCSTFRKNPNMSVANNTAITPESIQESIAAGEQAVKSNPIGGNIANGMDELDRSKLSHALDKAPGKETTWVNAISGVHYTVVPVKKISINGFQFCREYNVKATTGSNTRDFTGNACIAANGNWREV
jgi:surface antigen